MTSRRRTRSFLPIAAVALLALPAFAAEVPDQLPDPNGKPDAEQEAPKTVHFDPVIKDIEGWTVHVDPRMLEGEHAEAGGRALTMLANQLQRIAILMPEDRLKEMRKLEIWIEHDHPEINVEPGPYHPDVGWLTARGYDARLAKKVHVTRAASLLSRHQMIKHPAEKSAIMRRPITRNISPKEPRRTFTATTSTRSCGRNSSSTIPCCMICLKKSGAR